MIACHSKHLIERCLQRGYALDEVTPCVVSMDGDIWTINVDHDSYPRGVGALSFECVPDCTTPDFVCLPGYCCTENILDGSNSCLPCPSSSSSESPSSSSSPACSIPIYSRYRVYNCQSEIGGSNTLSGYSNTVEIRDTNTNQVVLTGTVPSGSGEYTYLGMANLSSVNFSVTNTTSIANTFQSTSGTCGTDRFLGVFSWLNGGC
jgi:hypothetical protein